MSQPLVNETLAVYSNAKDENKLHKADSKASGRSAFSAKPKERHESNKKQENMIQQQKKHTL